MPTGTRRQFILLPPFLALHTHRFFSLQTLDHATKTRHFLTTLSPMAGGPFFLDVRLLYRQLLLLHRCLQTCEKGLPVLPTSWVCHQASHGLTLLVFAQITLQLFQLGFARSGNRTRLCQGASRRLLALQRQLLQGLQALDATHAAPSKVANWWRAAAIPTAS